MAGPELDETISVLSTPSPLRLETAVSDLGSGQWPLSPAMATKPRAASGCLPRDRDLQALMRASTRAVEDFSLSVELGREGGSLHHPIRQATITPLSPAVTPLSPVVDRYQVRQEVCSTESRGAGMTQGAEVGDSLETFGSLVIGCKEMTLRFILIYT